MAACDRLCLLSLFLFSIIGRVLSGVPVLLWESSSMSNKNDLVPAMYQLDSDEFSNHIVKKIHVHKSLIVLFLAETLSIEDFSWQDVQHQGFFPQLSNLTKMSAKVEFIPSVEYPVDALKGLEVSHNYQWKKYDKNNLPMKGGVILEVKMKDALNNEDRPDLLRRNDANIAEIYSQLLAKHSSIIAIFTGKQSSWVELESNRVRREAEEVGNSSATSASPTTPSSTPSDILRGVVGNESFIIDLFDSPVVELQNKTMTLTEVSQCCMMDNRNDYIRLISTHRTPEEKVILRFRFQKHENRWQLPNMTLVPTDAKETDLFPDVDISAPIGKSFKTTSPVTFKSLNGDIAIRFNGIQTQAYTATTGFGPAVKATAVFFTPGIWSGLIVTFILGVILTWGIVMLMDIRTMDRFDDPKGKTISTTATE